MAIEQKKVLEALQFAIQMEIDGKKFYQVASKRSDNSIGADLFQTLAVEEDKHRETFEKIHQTIIDKKAWPKIDMQIDMGKKLRTVFAEATKTVGSEIEVRSTEIDAAKTAMDMENKSFDYYKDQSQRADYDVQKEFFELLAAEERGHFLILLDYYEYLKDPGAWFVQQEHPSLDGV